MDTVEQLDKYRLLQRKGVFKLCGDTLALGKFSTVKRGNNICDLGCGCGALGLLLLEREPTANVTGLDLDPKAVALAQENFTVNRANGAARQGDIRQARALFPGGSFDLVVTNPPYFPAASGRSGGMARMEEACTLEDVCAAAEWLLKNGGRMALVHRPERLADLICALRAHRLEPKRIHFLCHAPDAAPSAVLLEAMKNGRAGLAYCPRLEV